MINHQRSRVILAITITALLVGGCVSDGVNDASLATAYQRRLARSGPQRRLDAEVPVEEEPLGLLKPADEAAAPVPDLPITTDPNTGRKVARLTLEQAIVMTLASSPEIRVISFDPEVARQEITAAAGVFDPTVFSRVNYEDQDSPRSSIYEPGEAETRLFESGVRQRTPLGTEWSASYALARIWDDLLRPIPPTRYEPAAIFEFKQPLLRDAWQEVNLAGVDVARLNYEAALLSFRERVEEVSGGVAITYWRLTQARRDLEIQRQLVEQTQETLRKVEGRRDIDATDVQIKQAQAYAMSRRATLLELQKRVVDAQDALVRLIADPRINTTMELEIVPESEPQMPEELPELVTVTDRALATALQQNPVVQRAQLGVEVAQINVRVAQNQRMPRLDLVGSTRARGLAQDYPIANDQIGESRYVSYSVGVTFEYPLGNRQRQAEWMRRKLEQRKAISTLHATADRVALVVKEAIRRVRTNQEQAQVQQEAAEAARIHLQTLEEAEQVRDRLTPEFLLVKLQGQETYAQTRRAEVAALVELNVAVAELAQNTGTILGLRMIESAMDSVVGAPSEEDGSREAPRPQRLLPPIPRSPSL